MDTRRKFIEEIESRWAKVTKGQWQIWPANWESQRDRKERRIYAVTLGEQPWMQPRWGKEVAWLRAPSDFHVDEVHENAVAITAAPTDIAFLLSEVERLRKEQERDAPLIAAVEAWEDARIARIEAIGTKSYWQADDEHDLASATLRAVLKERRVVKSEDSNAVRS